MVRYSSIVSEFQRLLVQYYDRPVHQIPTVQYFAARLDLTPNYLGDVIKQLTQKSAIETIHEFVIARAKGMLEKRMDLNTSAIAHALGFGYPNYFAKFFKKHVRLAPKQYRAV